MTGSRNRDTLSASEKGIEIIKKAQKRLGKAKIILLCQISESTLERFLKGKSIQRENALNIIKKLELKEEDVLQFEDDTAFEQKVEETVEKIQQTNSENAYKFAQNFQKSFEKYKQDKKLAQKTMDWLKGNREFFVKEAVEESLKNLNLEDDEYSKNVEQLDKDLMRYLHLCYSCLKLGSLGFIDKQKQKSSIPLNMDLQLYIKGLTFIKEEKVKKLPKEQSQGLELCIDYIIITLNGLDIVNQYK